MGGQGSFQGPHVRVEREGTADAGGGTLQVMGGRVLVQGAVRGRELGEVPELHRMTFADHRGTRLTLHFFDAAWQVEAGEGAGDLLAFAEFVQAELGRTDMVVLPPSPTEQLRAEMTLERGRMLGALAAGGLLAVGVYFAAARVVPIGYAVLGVTAPLLIALLASALVQAGPAWLSAFGRLAGAWGWVVSVGVPAMWLVAACMGVLAAGDRVAQAAADAQARADAAADAAVARAEVEAQARRESAALAELLAEVKLMADKQRLPEAEAMLAQAEAIAPGAPAVAAMRKSLASQFAQAQEAVRVLDIRKGLKLARAVVGDTLRCESAKAVSDAWHGIRQVAADDPDLAAVQKMVPKLEACRKRVLRTFSRGARDARQRARAQLASSFESELRRQGTPVSIELRGRSRDSMRISLDRLDGETAAAVVGAGGGDETLLQRAEAAGFRLVELRDGARGQRNYRLKPPSEKALGAELLQGFGLASALALPSGE